MSLHAERRCNQRGIRGADLDLLGAHADVVIPAGRGAQQWMLSAEAATDLISLGVSVQVVDRVRRLAAISAEGQWLTAHHAERGRRKRLRKSGGRRARSFAGRG